MQKASISRALNEAIYILAAKRTSLNAAADKTSTLVVGSSHGDFGFDPQFFPNSFNLCSRSQDLKHSYHLYTKTSSLCPNLKNLVVFYSVFSSGFELEKIPGENEICVALNEVFKLGLCYDVPSLADTASYIKNKIDDLKVDKGLCGFLPDLGKGFFPESYGAQRRADDHIKLNKYTSSNKYLRKLLQETARNGHKVWVVIPPARSDYLSAIHQSNETLFSDAVEILNEHKSENGPVLIDYFRDPRFLDRYFGDFDHLLPCDEGARLLSASICDAVNSLGAGNH